MKAIKAPENIFPKAIDFFVTICYNCLACEIIMSIIRRGIEAVMTGLTRKKIGFVTISALEFLVNSHFFGI